MFGCGRSDKIGTSWEPWNLWRTDRLAQTGVLYGRRCRKLRWDPVRFVVTFYHCQWYGQDHCGRQQRCDGQRWRSEWDVMGAKICQSRKRGNCECTATWGRPTPRSPYPLSFHRPCQVWSRSPIRCRLEHVSRAPLCCWIVCTKFIFSQAIRSSNVTMFLC